MNKNHKVTLKNSISALKKGVESASKSIDAIPTQDIGPSVLGREEAQNALNHFEAMEELICRMSGALEMHIGAIEVLDKARYPKPKLLSASRP